MALLFSESPGWSSQEGSTGASRWVRKAAYPTAQALSSTLGEGEKHLPPLRYGFHLQSPVHTCPLCRVVPTASSHQNVGSSGLVSAMLTMNKYMCSGKDLGVGPMLLGPYYMARCLQLCVIWPGPGVVAALQHHVEKPASLGPFPPFISQVQTPGPRPNSALHLVFSGSTLCFYPAAALSSLLLVKE